MFFNDQNLINIKQIEDQDPKNGKIIVLQENENIPFDIKRVYCIFCSNKDTVRGKHAHKNLKQAIICLSGHCKVILDNGTSKKTYKLDSQDRYLLINECVWREITDFSENCILMVLASEVYNENDYIRDYSKFLEFVSSYV
ncbi:MAG: hypothetical protein BGO27_04410 [Alphaproteobacteria bacterium 33-17]|mgnify:CR=1 FL=1|nr:MAG: hypothetical protein BGO27_04410 [Alphaproteobacteria bacterium 33-17]